MGQVTVNVNGRAYRFDCGDGEEARLNELAAYVKGRIDSLVKEFGKVGDERLLLTAALLIADELMDTRANLAAARAASGDHVRVHSGIQDASEPEQVTAPKEADPPATTAEGAGPEEVLRKAVGAAL